MGKILIVDDEHSMCQFMEIMLAKEGYNVVSEPSANKVLKLLDSPESGEFDLVIADLMMPEMSGIDLLERTKKAKPDLDFIIMTAFGSIESAVEALKKGATEYITKPFQVDEVKHTIKKCLEKRRVIHENRELRKKLSESGGLAKFIGSSSKVVELKRMVERIAVTDSTVLIKGESGCGKELIAKAIHDLSPRADRPFVSINCGALPETLLESELFGYKKGAFTGANKDKTGLIQTADQGSFFLDELGNMPLSIQAKLLRVIEQMEVTPLGDTKRAPVNVRLIAATNADLESVVESGDFRADLFYRLNVLPILIPPLRERAEDIPALVSHFVKRSCEKLGCGIKRLSESVLTALMEYNWPGNVRELENAIEQATLLSTGDLINKNDLSNCIVKSDRKEVTGSQDSVLTPPLNVMEEAYILYVLNQTDWNKTKAAKVLGIDASTLYRKIDRYKLKEKAQR
ncbi:MAG: response regulator [candidate division Zixibacteria bacterium]|nr:response regulator [candidate division Zixibacteria bacterium]